jgi:hypothetical protein
MYWSIIKGKIRDQYRKNTVLKSCLYQFDPRKNTNSFSFIYFQHSLVKKDNELIRYWSRTHSFKPLINCKLQHENI